MIRIYGCRSIKCYCQSIKLWRYQISVCHFVLQWQFFVAFWSIWPLNAHPKWMNCAAMKIIKSSDRKKYWFHRDELRLLIIYMQFHFRAANRFIYCFSWSICVARTDINKVIRMFCCYSCSAMRCTWADIMNAFEAMGTTKTVLCESNNDETRKNERNEITLVRGSDYFRRRSLHYKTIFAHAMQISGTSFSLANLTIVISAIPSLRCYCCHSKLFERTHT